MLAEVCKTNEVWGAASWLRSLIAGNAESCQQDFWCPICFRSLAKLLIVGLSQYHLAVRQSQRIDIDKDPATETASEIEVQLFLHPWYFNLDLRHSADQFRDHRLQIGGT